MELQTRTTSKLWTRQELVDGFVGKRLSAVRTPAAVIDRTAFRRNCQAMKDRCERVGASFRAHVKSHKTAEGTRIQLQTDPPTHAVVCSTLPEAWGLVDAGLTRDGTVKDLLYGFPLPVDKLEDLCELQRHVETLTVMIDCPDQVDALDAFSSADGRRSPTKPWQAFIKVDQGNERAGIKPREGAAVLRSVVERVSKSPNLTLHGFYSHSGNAYASRSPKDAEGFLEAELEACEAALSTVPPPSSPLVVSVGSTPTAHACLSLSKRSSSHLFTIEVHAGVYPLLDLQQRATGLVADPTSDLALSVLARVCSKYPQRTPSQVLVDAGAIAFSKDGGPIKGFGEVVSTGKVERWYVKMISQEHGILAPPADVSPDEASATAGSVELGTLVRIRPQHACLTCAGHGWYFIVDGPADDTIRDVWVPWKGW